MNRSGEAPLLVRIPNWLGDLVLAFPVLTAAAETPALFLGPETFRELLEPRFPTVPYLSVGRDRRWAPLATIREARPRAALLLTDSLSSAVLAWLARIPNRIGYAAEGRGPLLTRRVPRPGPARSTRRVAEYGVLAGAAGLSVRSEIPTLAALPEEAARAEALLGERGLGRHPYLVVAPGASYGPAKQWGPERFAEAASSVARSRGLAIVVVGAPEDRGATGAVARAVAHAGPSPGTRAAAVDLAGATTLGALIGVLAGAKAVISNDSGVMHVAAALRRPTVGIFGSTSPVWTSASSEWVANLYAAYPCSPCYRRTCPIGYGCLRSIGSDEAGRALDRLLG